MYPMKNIQVILSFVEFWFVQQGYWLHCFKESWLHHYKHLGYGEACVYYAGIILGIIGHKNSGMIDNFQVCMLHYKTTYLVKVQNLTFKLSRILQWLKLKMLLQNFHKLRSFKLKPTIKYFLCPWQHLVLQKAFSCIFKVRNVMLCV